MIRLLLMDTIYKHLPPGNGQIDLGLRFARDLFYLSQNRPLPFAPSFGQRESSGLQ